MRFAIQRPMQLCSQSCKLFKYFSSVLQCLMESPVVVALHCLLIFSDSLVLLIFGVCDFRCRRLSTISPLFLLLERQIYNSCESNFVSEFRLFELVIITNTHTHTQTQHTHTHTHTHTHVRAQCRFYRLFSEFVALYLV